MCFRILWLYIKANGFFASIKRNTWESVGGHIETGESPLEAEKRELYEETGLDVVEILGENFSAIFLPYAC